MEIMKNKKMEENKRIMVMKKIKCLFKKSNTFKQLKMK